jgi:hypothetical protein
MGFSHSSTKTVTGPIRLKLISGESIQSAIATLLGEAIQRRQSGRNGSQLTRVMTYLVEAWLILLQEHKGTGYQANHRTPSMDIGEFRVGSTIIHVTSAPEPNLIDRCLANRRSGFRPLIISTRVGALYAEDLADQLGSCKVIEVLDITQFLVANMLEWTGSNGSQRRHTFEELIARYNAIVEACETDPSLKIEVA